MKQKLPCKTLKEYWEYTHEKAEESADKYYLFKNEYEKMNKIKRLFNMSRLERLNEIMDNDYIDENIAHLDMIFAPKGW